MERNFETVMIEQCAPVLAGLKPAGLFRYETRDCADLARRVRSWNEQLASKGLSVRVLKGCVRTHQFLIYVYREARLRAIFADEAVRAFLAREGYQLPQSREQTGIMLTQLSRRLCCSAEFPHEIGVFLGYPLTDVVGIRSTASMRICSRKSTTTFSAPCSGKSETRTTYGIWTQFPPMTPMPVTSPLTKRAR